MKIRVDYERCCGSAMCTSIAEQYFYLDPAGKLELHQADVAETDRELLQEASNCCPTEAISLVDCDHTSTD
jgi:ferredoxin